MIAAPAARSAYRKRHPPLRLSGGRTSAAFKVLLQLRNALAGHTGEDIQQVGNPRFVLYIVAHNRRLVGVGHGTLELLTTDFGSSSRPITLLRLSSDLDIFWSAPAATSRVHQGFWNKWLWHFEHFPYRALKRWRRYRSAQVLFLVFTHRHLVGLIQQNVSRHQHRIVKQTGVNVLGIARGFIQTASYGSVPKVGVAVRRPAKLCMFRRETERRWCSLGSIPQAR